MALTSIKKIQRFLVEQAAVLLRVTSDCQICRNYYFFLLDQIGMACGASLPFSVVEA